MTDRGVWVSSGLRNMETTKPRNSKRWLVASRILALAVPLLVTLLVVFPYGLREYCESGVAVLGGIFSLFFALPLLAAMGRPGLVVCGILFSGVFPWLAVVLGFECWNRRWFWLAWVLYLAMLAWDSWLGISFGKVLTAFGTLGG